jgi:hypothetical protein
MIGPSKRIGLFLSSSCLLLLLGGGYAQEAAPPPSPNSYLMGTEGYDKGRGG